MENKKLEKESAQIENARNARLIDVHDGPLGQDKVTVVEGFANCLLRVPYLPRGKPSDYAIHRPVRILLKSYRMFRNLPPDERRFHMAAQLRQVFISPPIGIFGPEFSEVEDKTFQVVDEFLNLLGFLYADIPSLVSRNEKRLVHAVDLAMQLSGPQVWLEFRLNQAKKLPSKIREILKLIQSAQTETASEEEKAVKVSKLNEQLKERKLKLMDDLDYLKKKGREEEADQIAAEAKTITEQGGTL